MSEFYEEQAKVRKELASGGKWLGEARKWMQSNVKEGDRLSWNSSEIVHLPFYKLEELAKAVAIAAVLEERQKKSKNEN